MADKKKNVLEALRQWEADAKNHQKCMQPELVAASRLRLTWGKDGEEPGHAGVQPGAVFSSDAQLLLLGLHGSVFRTNRNVEAERKFYEHFWSRKQKLLAVALDIDLDTKGGSNQMPEEGLFWSEKKPNKTGNKAEGVWVNGLAGEFDGEPNGKHQDKGSAGLLTSALQSKQVVRVLRAFQVPIGHTPTRWWVYAGLFKVVATDKFRNNKQTRCRYLLEGVPGQSLNHQELRDRVSKVHRGSYGTDPLDPRASKKTASGSQVKPTPSLAAGKPTAQAFKPHSSITNGGVKAARAINRALAMEVGGLVRSASVGDTGERLTDSHERQLSPPDHVGPDLDMDSEAPQQGQAKNSRHVQGGGKRQADTSPESQDVVHKKARQADVPTSEADQIKAWQVGLTGRPHVIRMDLTRSNRLPVPVFKEPRPDHLGPDAQAEQDAQAELEFEYVHDYKWEDGVLKEVWPVLMHEENVMRKTAAELRQGKVDEQVVEAVALGIPLAASAEAWWEAGPKRSLCGTLLHAYLHRQHLAAERQLTAIDENVLSDHRAALLELLEGPTLPLEVFRAYTPAAGSSPDLSDALLSGMNISQGHWGVRCHIPIRKGRFVCCVLGQLTTMSRVLDIMPHEHVMHMAQVSSYWQFLRLGGVNELQQEHELRVSDLPAPPTSSPYMNCSMFWQSQDGATGHDGPQGAGAASGGRGSSGGGRPGKPEDVLGNIWRAATLGDRDLSTCKYPASLSLLALDTRTHGNVSRLIRHSLQPNLGMQIVYAGSCRSACLYYMALIAAEDIPAGTELTYDHTLALWVPDAPRDQENAPQAAPA